MRYTDKVFVPKSRNQQQQPQPPRDISAYAFDSVSPSHTGPEHLDSLPLPPPHTFDPSLHVEGNGGGIASSPHQRPVHQRHRSERGGRGRWRVAFAPPGENGHPSAAVQPNDETSDSGQRRTKRRERGPRDGREARGGRNRRGQPQSDSVAEATPTMQNVDEVPSVAVAGTKGNRRESERQAGRERRGGRERRNERAGQQRSSSSSSRKDQQRISHPVAHGSELSGLAEELLTGLLNDSYECMICMNFIRRRQSIWHCEECYALFHLDCISKWSKNSMEEARSQRQSILPQKAPLDGWRCPHCNKVHREHEGPPISRCFCGKVTNPEFNPYITPHSCGDLCGRMRIGTDCPHPCNMYVQSRFHVFSLGLRV